MEVLVFLIVILLGLVLYMLVKISRFSTVFTKKPEKATIDRSHQVNGVMMLVFLVVGMIAVTAYSIIALDDYHTEAASVHGVSIDNAINITLIITGFVFVVTQVALFYFAYRYRHKKKSKAFYFPVNYTMEIIWTAIPAITFAGLFILSATSSREIYNPPSEDAVLVEVVGQQFNWNVRYPGRDQDLGAYDFRLIDAENNLGLDMADPAGFDDFTPSQMVVPVGREVEMKIRSKDVIHSVFLTQFRVKMDAVPGMPTRFKFIPKYTTEEMREKLGKPDFEYELACAELCGRGHFAMKFIVRVVEEDEFEAWYNEQRPWLVRHPAYLESVPEDLREQALSVLDRFGVTAAIDEDMAQ